MGAGQIGGLSTLLDIDFNNAAGFLGTKADVLNGQFVVYFLSHAMMFCVGSLLEGHVVLTPASCVFGERYKFDVFGGTHRFLEHVGVARSVDHVCTHSGYNHSLRWDRCLSDNIALLVLGKPFSFHNAESGMDFKPNKIRYLSSEHTVENRIGDTSCRFYGWGSRRNGFLIPLLIYLQKVDVRILSKEKCPNVWNNDDKYLCVQQPFCKSEKFGALCPDDLGSLLVCSGFAEGMMTSRLIDRPCGVGFLDLSKYSKFLMCGVDNSRDVIGSQDHMTYDFSTEKPKPTVVIYTPPDLTHSEETTKVEEEKPIIEKR